jgi:hypothetical protein
MRVADQFDDRYFTDRIAESPCGGTRTQGRTPGAVLCHAGRRLCGSRPRNQCPARYSMGRESASMLFRVFPRQFWLPIAFGEDHYEECKYDSAGAAVSQHPGGRSSFCGNSERVSNSTNFRCGVCGSEAILSLRLLIDGPPSGSGRNHRRVPRRARPACT